MPVEPFVECHGPLARRLDLDETDMAWIADHGSFRSQSAGGMGGFLKVDDLGPKEPKTVCPEIDRAAWPRHEPVDAIAYRGRGLIEMNRRLLLR